MRAEFLLVMLSRGVWGAGASGEREAAGSGSCVAGYGEGRTLASAKRRVIRMPGRMRGPSAQCGGSEPAVCAPAGSLSPLGGTVTNWCAVPAEVLG